MKKSGILLLSFILFSGFNVRCIDKYHHSLPDLEKIYNSILSEGVSTEKIDTFKKIENHLLVYHRGSFSSEDMEKIVDMQFKVALIRGTQENN